MMSYLYVALAIAALMALFGPTRKALSSFVRTSVTHLIAITRTVGGIVLKAHMDLFANLMPRNVVIKTLNEKNQRSKK